jgi:DNA repair protein RadA/Sms
MTICSCGAHLETGVVRCSKCGRWQLSKDEFQQTSHATVCLADVEASDVHRLTSGPWDQAWGGGIVRDTVTMFAGAPGAGKSTNLLQIAAAVALSEPKRVLYIAIEESAGQIKARAERLKISFEAQQKIIIVPHFEGPIVKLLETHSPSIIILDSLPALAGTGAAGIQPALHILEEIRSYVLRESVPAVVIDHVIKDGDFGGAMSWQHLVDVTLMLELHERSDGLMVRRLGAVKNRHGAAACAEACQDFLMTETGLVGAPSPNDENDETSPKPAKWERND